MSNERTIKSQVMVIALSKEAISDRAISLLNFVEEPVTAWLDSKFTTSDLARFLNELYDQPSLLLTKSGDVFKTDDCVTQNVNQQFLETGIQKGGELVSKFTEFALNATPAPAAAQKYKPIKPDYFLNSPVFGKTLKYLVAWDNICCSILAESVFFSEAHLLEADTDTEVSVDMAARLYYKQSFQILRGFLENVVLPVHFCNQPDEFEQWRSNGYRTPPLRGKQGLLNKLAKSGVITNELRDNASSLYQQLNGSIHGGERYLIHKGIHKNEWSGLLFKEQDFLDWCLGISKAVEISAKLLLINVQQLLNLRGSSGVVCVTCHNDKDFKLEEFTFGGRNFKRYHCPICGHEMTFDKNGNLSHTVTHYAE